MPTLYTTIGPWTFQTFTLFLALATLAGAVLALRRTANPGAAADVYLAASIGAIVGARLFHVLLNWDYFAEALNEAANISLGGLDWHGAVVGGSVGLYGGVRIRNVAARKRDLSPPLRFSDLLDSLTFVLPLLGLGGWWGCLAANCGYGAEVDNLSNYPSWAVSERGDVYGIAAPRYDTQAFGLILSLFILVLVILVFWRGWLRHRRFWLTLALFCMGMFAIGVFRGDHVMMFAGIRGDQILDVLVFASAAAILSRPLTQNPPPSDPA
jgi:phosphatidylglycerol---prolipoprotein diacylglyceryl transferase